MSNLERAPEETVCGTAEPGRPVVEPLAGREVVLGGPRGMRVTRTLPTKGRRMVGAWCFLDAYGPEQAVMRVPPHPHTGLQTVSWLVDGEVLHRDSVGSEQLIKPGQLNLMTAGRGIAHSEESAFGRIHGAQLWVALPGAHRHVPPHFEHHPALPVLTLDGGAEATVLMGELGGVASPAVTYSPLVGAELTLEAPVTLPLTPGFEYALLALDGAAEVEGTSFGPGPLIYLGAGRHELTLHARESARLLLLGGVPFEEEIVMWWNFVGRSHQEIVEFRENWMAEGRGFGQVAGFDGPPLPAPALPGTTLKPRGRER
ncbi:pirin family protein [Acrocarpospora catenulata]|uniref:pirin family protein n=1 Tax=Acrocarpospora catenulata TaxID=2836182 RepID=UPI001BDB4FEF|nr:pirin family protein [Acrocarpospora catenulata]